MALVQMDSVSLRYTTGGDVLRDINVRLEPGSFHYLTGDSGSGKTSFMRLLSVLEKPTVGRITLFGHALNDIPRGRMPDIRRKIGVVFQEFRLLGHLSAFDNVALPLRMAGVHEDAVRRNVNELLRWVGLGDQGDARPETLSGGEQQRIAVARAVINQPRLLLADEPTASIDDATAARLMMLFEELNRHGTTVIVATHDESMVRRFPHPTLRLEKGLLRAGGGTRAAA